MRKGVFYYFNICITEAICLGEISVYFVSEWLVLQVETWKLILEWSWRIILEKNILKSSWGILKTDKRLHQKFYGKQFFGDILEYKKYFEA